MKLLVILLIGLSAISFAKGSEKKVVCYWNSFSVKNEGLKGMFGVKDIDPTICTHIIYAYLRFTASVIIFPDYNEDDLREFINLKAQNPNVKLLIGVGGPRQGFQIPSQIASTAVNSNEFSQKLNKFIVDYGFDGCDLNWQWPGLYSPSNDKYNFIRLLEWMRSVLTKSKILSISVAPRPEDIDKSYNITEIVKRVDFINLNTYDLHEVGNSTNTFFHSAYRKAPNDQTREGEWNAESVIKNWLSNGAPAEKLTLGIPTYGRSFTLLDVLQTGVGAPVDEIGLQSEYLAEKTNIIPYMEICNNILTNPRWYNYWNSAQFAPYVVFNANQWVGYDDLLVVKAKIHLALENDLGGLNYATIDRDDFAGQCGGDKFPLIKLGHDALINGIIPENPLKPSSVTVTSSTTPETTTVAPIFQCPVASGIFRHPYDCTKFLMCINGLISIFQCPYGLYFDEVNNFCNFPCDVECNV